MNNRTISAVAFGIDGLLFNTGDLYDEVAERIAMRRRATIDHGLIRRMVRPRATLRQELMDQRDTH